uniref:Odorant binding protein 9 n=1 Tax=Aphis glycines TaxID=307491 RepID=W8E7E0_APHGL|nr:odorant binding protein 9 [Aphis glycines]
MIIKKTLLVSGFVLFGCMFSINKAADDADAKDKELMSKLITVAFKCFKDADWGTCGEMITTKYDITQAKYKQCTCHMACAGEDLGLINSNGQPEPAKFLEYVKRINNSVIKSQLQHIYDKCQNVKGTEKCDLAEQFAICAFKESPEMKERVTKLIEMLVKMKPKSK